MNQLKYRVNILWSEEDKCYLVELPEFATEIQRYFTHGDTYEDALSHAQEILELLIASNQVGWAKVLRPCPSVSIIAPSDGHASLCPSYALP